MVIIATTQSGWTAVKGMLVHDDRSREAVAVHAMVRVRLGASWKASVAGHVVFGRAIFV